MNQRVRKFVKAIPLVLGVLVLLVSVVSPALADEEENLAPACGTYTVYGVVLDGETLEGIPAAILLLMKVEGDTLQLVDLTVSDATGNFVFSDISPGLYELREINNRLWSRDLGPSRFVLDFPCLEVNGASSDWVFLDGR